MPPSTMLPGMAKMMSDNPQRLAGTIPHGDVVPGRGRVADTRSRGHSAETPAVRIAFSRWFLRRRRTSLRRSIPDDQGLTQDFALSKKRTIAIGNSCYFEAELNIRKYS